MTMLSLDLTNSKEIRKYIRIMIAIIVMLTISLIWMWDSAKSIKFYMDCTDLKYKEGVSRVTPDSRYWDRLPARSDGDGDGMPPLDGDDEA